MNVRKLFAESAKALGAALLVLAAAEVLLRVAYAVRNAAVDVVVLPYNAAQDFGPMPPWLDDMRILETDDELFWRNRRNVIRRYLDVYSPVEWEADRAALLRRFLPNVPASLRGNPVWEVSLDDRGFRNAPFQTKKAPGVFRIVCLGDSWTFGANVDQAEAYPQQLEVMLEQEFPEGEFEVLNWGTLAYSSYQGLELMRRQVLSLAPDVVLIGFGMNDASIAGYRDKDLRPQGPSVPLAKRLRKKLELLEIFKLLNYVARILRHETWSIGDYMDKLADAAGTPSEAWIGGKGTESADYEELEPYTRVSPVDYEHNVREMVRLARSRGAGGVLLYNELWSTPYREVLRRIATSEDVGFVDSQTLIARARAMMQQELEARLGLEPPPGRPLEAPESKKVEVVFRVHAGKWNVADALYIAGPHPELGDGVPNRVAMRDDGTHGDQRAGDGVWSYLASFEPGMRIFYVYTNSGEEGRWHRVDVPEVRRFTIEVEEGRVWLPIDTFGEIYLQADGWHTNAAGYEIIARAVVELLAREEGTQRYLAELGAQRK
jgi:lysophospholipase L1-like esterase